jgi:hypothetical protein
MGILAAIGAGFDFRRYAMNPIPARPISSIAHVGGSGEQHHEAIQRYCRHHGVVVRERARYIIVEGTARRDLMSRNSALVLALALSQSEILPPEKRGLKAKGK